MSSTSSLRYGMRRHAAQASPALPLVACPDCGQQVKVFTSSTDVHTGWIFYKCKTHGSTCNFWHWEREYVYYLCENNVLAGDAEVEAVGWAKERRKDMELALGKKKLAEQWGVGHVNGASSSSSNGARGDAMVRRRVNELVLQGREVLVLMKISLGLLCVFFVALLSIVVILKKLSQCNELE